MVIHEAFNKSLSERDKDLGSIVGIYALDYKTELLKLRSVGHPPDFDPLQFPDPAGACRAMAEAVACGFPEAIDQVRRFGFLPAGGIGYIRLLNSPITLSESVGRLKSAVREAEWSLLCFRLTDVERRLADYKARWE